MVLVDWEIGMVVMDEILTSEEDILGEGKNCIGSREARVDG